MIFDSKGDAWFTAQGAGGRRQAHHRDGKVRTGRWSRGRARTASSSTRRIVPGSTCSARTRSARSIPRPASSRRTRCRTSARVPAASPSRMTTASGTATTRAASSAGSIRRAARDRGVCAARRSGLAAVRAWPATTAAASGWRRRARSRTGSSRSTRRRRSFTETVTIAADKANTIRHMTFDKSTRQIWFGGDANMIGRVQVAPEPLVP